MDILDPILRPLARLAVCRGWLFPLVEHRLRLAYIKAAETLNITGATDSKISISTGLQRREIARLRKETAPATPTRQPLAEIISLWWDDPAFDTSGIPTKGDHPSFASLASRIRKDVHPRTFLDILIENGAVREIDDTVCLTTRTFQPRAGSDEQLAYLGDNVGDHLEAAVSNVLNGAERYDMSVHYKGLSETAIADLDRHFRIRMRQTLEELDTMARSFPDAENGRHRFRAGGYFCDDLDSKGQPNDP